MVQPKIIDVICSIIMIWKHYPVKGTCAVGRNRHNLSGYPAHHLPVPHPRVPALSEGAVHANGPPCTLRAFRRDIEKKDDGKGELPEREHGIAPVLKGIQEKTAFLPDYGFKPAGNEPKKEKTARRSTQICYSLSISNPHF